MAGEQLSRWEQVLTVGAGFTLVAFVTALAWAFDLSSSTNPVFDRYVQPTILAATGVGTGHYLGRAIREYYDGRVLFMVGFFVGVFLYFVAFLVVTDADGLVLPVLLVFGTLFAFMIHVSPLVPGDDQVTRTMAILGPVTTAFVVVGTVVALTVSYGVPVATGASVLTLIVLALAAVYYLEWGVDYRTVG